MFTYRLTTTLNKDSACVASMRSIIDKEPQENIQCKKAYFVCLGIGQRLKEAFMNGEIKGIPSNTSTFTLNVFVKIAEDAIETKETFLMRKYKK